GNVAGPTVTVLARLKRRTVVSKLSFTRNLSRRIPRAPQLLYDHALRRPRHRHGRPGCRAALEALRPAGHGRPLLGLLLASAPRQSISCVARCFRLGFGRETARKAVAANLPDLGVLTEGLIDALFLFRCRACRRRRWVATLDLHYCPSTATAPRPTSSSARRSRAPTSSTATPPPR